MSYLRYFSFGVLASVGVLALIGWLFLPSKYQIEVTTLIKAPQKDVFHQVNNLSNWENWAFSQKKSEGLSFDYQGAEDGVGAVSQWLDNGMIGRLEIEESEPYSRVKLRALLQDGDFESFSTFRFEEQDGYTKVTWQEWGSFGNHIMLRFTASLMGFENSLKENYQSGLDLLKEEMEKNRE